MTPAARIAAIVKAAREAGQDISRVIVRDDAVEVIFVEGESEKPINAFDLKTWKK